MDRVIGIIPARGLASRFGGLPKELLPLSDNDCGLTRCVWYMQAADAKEVVVLTTHAKVGMYRMALKELPCVCLDCGEAGRGLWRDLLDVAKYPADWYLFGMPDTVFPSDAFTVERDHPVMTGTFLTDHPERFGMLHGNRIVDKQPGEPGYAWGVWIWSAEAMEYLIGALAGYQDHTQAINALLDKFGVKTFPLEYYYDFATFADYREYLRHD
jgi:hypothetical protein